MNIHLRVWLKALAATAVIVFLHWLGFERFSGDEEVGVEQPCAALKTVPVEDSGDGSYRYYDGCNWTTCHKDGLCTSTLLWCGADS